MSYAELHRLAPELVAFYLSDEVARICSRLFAVAVQPTPLHDQSSCSLLVYERPGDHIGWHYDHDFYRGRHFTVLLPLINQRSGAPGTSSAQLEAQIAGSCRFAMRSSRQRVVAAFRRNCSSSAPTESTP